MSWTFPCEDDRIVDNGNVISVLYLKEDLNGKLMAIVKYFNKDKDNVTYLEVMSQQDAQILIDELNTFMEVSKLYEKKRADVNDEAKRILEQLI